MPSRKRTEDEENAALAKEAERIAAKSAPAVDATNVTLDMSADVAATEPPPPPPAWEPHSAVLPPWVIGAERLAWKVKDAAKAWTDAFGDPLPSDASQRGGAEEPRARWTGGDIDYRYFKGGKVLATFRPDSKHGPVFGVLRTEPVAEFDADPAPAEQS